MQRILLGILALLLFAGGIALHFAGWEDAWAPAAAGIGIRLGLVLGAIWLALPQVKGIIKKLPPTSFWIAALGMVIIAVRPKAAIVVIPVLLALGLLQFIGWLMKPPPKRQN